MILESYCLKISIHYDHRVVNYDLTAFIRLDIFKFEKNLFLVLSVLCVRADVRGRGHHAADAHRPMSAPV